ncbi:MAG: hypothetical protein NC834_06800 [Candidatus Omnitrophica bacterium]|nr:hypothetical protein [Candidatus Omnitrophota bacterium]
MGIVGKFLMEAQDLLSVHSAKVLISIVQKKIEVILAKVEEFAEEEVRHE